MIIVSIVSLAICFFVNYFFWKLEEKKITFELVNYVVQ